MCDATFFQPSKVLQQIPAWPGLRKDWQCAAWHVFKTLVRHIHQETLSRNCLRRGLAASTTVRTATVQQRHSRMARGPGKENGSEGFFPMLPCRGQQQGCFPKDSKAMTKLSRLLSSCTQSISWRGGTRGCWLRPGQRGTVCRCRTCRSQLNQGGIKWGTRVDGRRWKQDRGWQSLGNPSRSVQSSLPTLRRLRLPLIPAIGESRD